MFCYENNLLYNSVIATYNKKCRHCKGWVFFDYSDVLYQDLLNTPNKFGVIPTFGNSKIYYLLNPNNEEVIVYNIKQFCIDNNLSYQGLRELGHKNNKKEHHKGWNLIKSIG